MLFDRKTEKIHKPDEQLSLFDMPEPDLPIQEEPETVTIEENFQALLPQQIDKDQIAVPTP